jgi:hypothetical protein
MVPKRHKPHLTEQPPDEGVIQNCNTRKIKYHMPTISGYLASADIINMSVTCTLFDSLEYEYIEEFHTLFYNAKNSRIIDFSGRHFIKLKKSNKNPIHRLHRFGEVSSDSISKQMDYIYKKIHQRNLEYEKRVSCIHSVGRRILSTFVKQKLPNVTLIFVFGRCCCYTNALRALRIYRYYNSIKTTISNVSKSEMTRKNKINLCKLITPYNFCKCDIHKKGKYHKYQMLIKACNFIADNLSRL